MHLIEWTEGWYPHELVDNYIVLHIICYPLQSSLKTTTDDFKIIGFMNVMRLLFINLNVVGPL